MGKIIVIRHGNTDFNTARVFQPHDAPLSTLGVQQAKNLGVRLKDHKIVKVLVSDLVRTKQTAQHILSARSDSVEMIESELLREREFGDLKHSSIDASLHLLHPKSDYLPPNGENWEMFHNRVRMAWDMVLSHAKESLKSGDDVMLVVTHGLVKSSLASRVWKIPTRPLPSFENTSISTVSLAAPSEVIVLNCTEHLEEHMKTRL